MNVQLTFITVMVMLPVSTLLEISHVLVTLDMKEMESFAQVCSLLVICLNVNTKINRNNEQILI